MFIAKNRLLGVIAGILLSTHLLAQAPKLELKVRYNLALSRYEVFARPDATSPVFNWGPSQITVVVPESVPDAALVVTSVAGGAWQDNSRVYAPMSAPGLDFHGVGSLGAVTSLEANVEKLIFHFTLPGDGCTLGLRLFMNGIDPNSSAPGMNGGDFSNTIFAIVPSVPAGYEAYMGNYDNNGTGCSALPLVLRYFDAESLDKTIELRWESERETEFSHFELERSLDGVTFDFLAKVMADKRLSGQYTFSDVEIEPGLTYFYRLKMVDNNGDFTFSNQVSGKLKKAFATIGALYPNPTSGQITIPTVFSEASVVIVTLTDLYGRSLQQRAIEVLAGDNNIHLDVSTLPSGMYFARLESAKIRAVFSVNKK